ncbi:MAG: BatA domain-containing protein [Verrucomicrobia bacterium]|nr:BatA domain-containing protein [Verrucomicrobiota bacterium]
MNFLAPLFLLGALAVALPVIYHLVRRTTRERTVFSSLMFLRPAPPRLTRRNRLEHLLLLLLRCAVIGLLAVGFARPFLKRALPEAASAGAPKRIVVLLDTSASMRRGRLWTEARDKAEVILRAASPADQAALFTFDRQLNPLISFEQWKSIPAGDRAALAHQRLAEAKAGWTGTLLDQALIRAAEMLAETDKGQVAGPRQVVLITDLQSGSRLNALQGYDWPKGVELVVERVAPRSAGNAGLHWVADSTDAPRTAEATVRVRVSNEPDSQREQFQVGWAGASGAFLSNAVDLYVPPGQSRVVALPVPPTAAGADRVLLRGDDEAFDNTVFVVPPEPARVSVLYLGSESETDIRQPLYFLRRAFQETRRQSVRVAAQKPSASLNSVEVTAANLLVVTDTLPPAQARVLQEQVSRGKTLLFAPTSATSAATLGALLGSAETRLDEAPSTRYAMLSEIDFRHPLFTPFADARFSDFTKIHFWKYRRLDDAALAGAKVVARFDSGDPALVEISVGQGRVLVLTSGWHPADSQLALSSKFVPLLYSMLELSGAAPPAPAQFIVGDAVPLPHESAQTNAALSIVRPDGSMLALSAGTTNFTETLAPGIYRLGTGPTAQRFAVNLDAAESRTAPLPMDELERLGAPTSRAALAVTQEKERKVQLQNAELEGRQKLWRWFIVATLAVLLIETWLAGRTARRLAATGGTA